MCILNESATTWAFHNTVNSYMKLADIYKVENCRIQHHAHRECSVFHKLQGEKLLAMLAGLICVGLRIDCSAVYVHTFVHIVVTFLQH